MVRLLLAFLMIAVVPGAASAESDGATSAQEDARASARDDGATTLDDHGPTGARGDDAASDEDDGPASAADDGARDAPAGGDAGAVPRRVTLALAGFPPAAADTGAHARVKAGDDPDTSAPAHTDTRAEEDPCADARAFVDSAAAGVALMVGPEAGASCASLLREAATAGVRLGIEIPASPSPIARAEGWIDGLVRGEELLALPLALAGAGRPIVLLPPDLDGAVYADHEALRVFLDARGLRPAVVDLDLRSDALESWYREMSVASDREAVAAAWRDDVVARMLEAAGPQGEHPPVVVLSAGALEREHLIEVLADLGAAGVALAPLDEAAVGPDAVGMPFERPLVPEEPAAEAATALPSGASPEELSAWLTRDPATARAAFEALGALGDVALPALLEGSLDPAPFRGGLLEPEPGAWPPAGLARLYLAEAILFGCARPAERIALLDVRQDPLVTPATTDAADPGDDDRPEDGSDDTDEDLLETVGEIVGAAGDGRPVRVSFRELPALTVAGDRTRTAGGTAAALEAAPTAEEPSGTPEASFPGVPRRDAWEIAAVAYAAFWSEHGEEPMALRRFRRRPLDGTGILWADRDPACEILPDDPS